MSMKKIVSLSDFSFSKLNKVSEDDFTKVEEDFGDEE